MFPAHVDYIMTYYPFILLKRIFCLYKSYTVPYLILFLSHTYNSVTITYNIYIYIVIRETGQFSSKGIINDFIGNLNRLTVSRRFTEQAV